MQLVTAARSWLVDLLNGHERGQTATENVLIIILAVVVFLIFAAIALTAHTLERGRRDQFVDRRERSASLMWCEVHFDRPADWTLRDGTGVCDACRTRLLRGEDVLAEISKLVPLAERG